MSTVQMDMEDALKLILMAMRNGNFDAAASMLASFGRQARAMVVGLRQEAAALRADKLRLENAEATRLERVGGVGDVSMLVGAALRVAHAVAEDDPAGAGHVEALAFETYRLHDIARGKETWGSLLFLDVDGVLNSHDYDAEAASTRIDRNKVARLNRILAATNARVVLSSAWRYLVGRGEMNLAGLDWLLRSHGLKAGVVVGLTHLDTPVRWDGGKPVEFVADERALQVARYREAVGHDGPYLVLDDMDAGFTAAGMPFVHVDGVVGLVDADVEAAIAELHRQMEARFGG